MSWIVLGLLSAVLLGCYDICKKISLSGNAVLPVLFLSTVAGALCVLPMTIVTAIRPDAAHSLGLFVIQLPRSAHLLILIKSIIVASSWIAAYFALKHLPISIAAPIRASQPIFTVIGAVLIFGEAPTPPQWVGLAVILTSYFIFARAGRLEGISFRTDKWILLMILAAALGASSAFYDKYLLQKLALPPNAVQTLFAFYLVPVMGLVLLVFWFPSRKTTTPFVWRWSIFLIGLLLILADYVYFHAIAQPEAKLAVLSAVRRTNVVISFCVGGLIFRDVNLRKKLLPVIGIVAGVLLILLWK